MESPPADGSTRRELADASLAELHEHARERGIERYRLLRREDLIRAVASDGGAVETESEAEPVGWAPPAPEQLEPEEPEAEKPEREPEPEPEEPESEPELEAEAEAEQGTEAHAGGILDLAGEGFGFVRGETLVRSDTDPFIARSQVRRLSLRAGDEVTGLVRPPRRGERHPAMVRVTSVNGAEIEGMDAAQRPVFDELQIARSSGALRLERGADDLAGRMIDLVAPLGRGQRGLVAGPPAAGASRLLRDVASALAGDDPHVIVVLCDVRPEEVLDWELAEGLELHAATAERRPDVQRRVAELALERAKRLAEDGRDVVLLLDSITRLARAYSLAALDRDGDEGDAPLDGAAVHGVKRWFASARNTRDAGSLTILAAARTGSDSRLDAAVYESLGDAANLELRLDPDLAARGHHPALDLKRSRALHEEGLIEADRLRRLELLRGVVRSLDAEEAWRFLAGKLRETGSNEALLAEQA